MVSLNHTPIGVASFTLSVVACILIVISVCKGQDVEVTECKLPDCFNPRTEIPGNLQKPETPMLVAFTFDDAVNDQVYESLKRLFNPNRTNPNGAPISMTLFVSHQFTNYCKVAEFYKAGHEIASHSITHRIPQSYWVNASYSDYDLEIDGQRTFLSTYAGFKREDIRGYRSPFLEPGGNTQFQVLSHRNFTYDSSLIVTTAFDKDRVWPYTLDIPNQIPCHMAQKCPSDKFPGVWELPIQPIPDHTGTVCSFLDRCIETKSTDEIYGYLFASFNSSYHRNKAPLIINMHAYWFDENPNGAIAFDDFIQDLVDMNDVYIITSNQVVEWMKKPTKLADLDSFQPFKHANRTTRRCSNTVSLGDQKREKKRDFEPYETKLRLLYDKHRPTDGGRMVAILTLFVFFISFLYIKFKEAPQGQVE